MTGELIAIALGLLVGLSPGALDGGRSTRAVPILVARGRCGLGSGRAVHIDAGRLTRAFVIVLFAVAAYISISISISTISTLLTA